MEIRNSLKTDSAASAMQLSPMPLLRRFLKSRSCRFVSGLGPLSAAVGVAALMLIALRLSAATYDAGPSQTYTNLGSVPWTALLPGDTVNIYYQPSGYHEIILLCNSGLPGAPITINGVPDPATGTLPTLDGQNAVTAANTPWIDPAQNLEGIIVVGRSDRQPYGYIPSWIVIQNLEVQNALSTNVLTQSDGTNNNFDSSAAAIYVEFAQHFVVSGCILNDSCNGFFCGSENNTTNELSADVLVENCWIHGNGFPGNYDGDNVNTESKGVVMQYNLIGPLAAGADGDQIVDRSSGTVLRYNEIIAGPGSGTAFWFSQTGGGAGIIDADPAYRTNYVYGNVFYNPSNSACGEMFRYDTLDILGSPRNGTLCFYNNTVVNYSAQSQRFGTGLFCLPTAAETQQWNLHDVLDCRNNIFANVPVPANAAPVQITFLISDDSTVNLGSNWISPGFLYYQLPYLSNTFFGAFNGTNQFIIGDRKGLNNPGFVNVAATNFYLLSSSPSIDAAGPQSPAVLSSPNNLTYEYLYPTNSQLKAVNGLGLDLGAFEGVSTNFTSPLFALTVSNGFGSGSYPAGAMVPIAASNAPAGQEFAGWTGAASLNSSSVGTTLTMPAGNLTVIASYTNLPAPSVYPLTVVNGTGSGSYLPGTVVTITANLPPAAEAFAGWTGYAVENANASTTTITMPAAAATVIANYQVSATYTLTVVNGSGSGVYVPGTVVGIAAESPPSQEVFANWSGYSVANVVAPNTTLTMPAANVVITANFQPATSPGGGPTNPPPGSGPTNAILFVTQARVPADFTTIASTFGNQQASPGSCGRGGDLYIR
jgi:hypothetical protein